MAVQEIVGGHLKDYQDPEGLAVSILLFGSYILHVFPLLIYFLIFQVPTCIFAYRYLPPSLNIFSVGTIEQPE